MTAIEGEVVHPETIILCEPGRAEQARRIADANGELGGLVQESETCPTGQIVIIDGQYLRETQERALEEMRRELFTPASETIWRTMPWSYGTFGRSAPLPRITYTS